MKRIYSRNELGFSLLWIGIYVVLMSVGDSISETIGMTKIVTAPIGMVLTLLLYLWIRKNDLQEKYGLCSLATNAKDYLYFIPLVFLASTNLWWGFQLNFTAAESVLHVISMMCVGFLEEVIFRGFLFQAISKTNVKRAIIISSVTFGIGHIVNLFHGKEIPETLMQICYAVFLGFLFTIIFYKGKNLWPCIITHGVLNSLSAFANEENAPAWSGMVTAVLLCAVSFAYAVYIIGKTEKAEKEGGF